MSGAPRQEELLRGWQAVEDELDGCTKLLEQEIQKIGGALCSNAEGHGKNGKREC